MVTTDYHRRDNEVTELDELQRRRKVGLTFLCVESRKGWRRIASGESANPRNRTHSWLSADISFGDCFAEAESQSRWLATNCWLSVEGDHTLCRGDNFLA